MADAVRAPAATAQGPRKSDQLASEIDSENTQSAAAVKTTLVKYDAAGEVVAEPADFQPAKKPTASPQFLQIVAKPDRRTKAKPESKLTRVAFRVSRLMEFCTQRELQNQTGHAVYDWPLVVLKELMDNALDACEEAEIAPVIEITVGDGSIIIQDNGGGIATDTIKSILDYSIRVSSREAYVSPTRGAQGNALKTILAMGYVLDRERVGSDTDAVGVTTIETRGVEHRIEFRVDHDRAHHDADHDQGGDQDHGQVALGAAIARRVRAGVQATRRVLCVVQSASDFARDLARREIPRRCGNQSNLGEMATA
jgi:hypothetical protein